MTGVVIFRHQLFKLSEPFIVQQAGQLNRYSPLYMGRERFGPSPANVMSFSMSDMPEQRQFIRKAWQVVTRDVQAYCAWLQGKPVGLIHAHFGVDAVYALPVANRLGLPLVTTFHGFDATTTACGLLKSAAPAWINYLLMRSALAARGHLFLCVSEFIRQKVLSLGFPPERTHVHYIGIDTAAITPRGAGESEQVILHVARLTEKKGTEFLLKAYAALPSNLKNYRLVIIGEGPLRPSLERLAANCGLGERIAFLGAQPHDVVMSWMRKASVLAIPSVTARSGDSEGLPMVLLEASALGIPVIGTWHAGIPEIVEDGRTGFLAPERDDAFLARRLMDLLLNDRLRTDMGVAAREHVVRYFDIHAQTAKLEAFYDGVRK